MNKIVILIGVFLVLIIVFYLYTRLTSGINTISSTQLNLNTAVPPALVTTITNPTSTRYAYGVWVYVNSWNNTNNKIIFSRYGDIVVYLDKTSASLKCVINPTSASAAVTSAAVIDPLTANLTAPTTDLTLSTNFPLQTWTQIIINIDNTLMDVYLNGKVIKSIVIPQCAPDKTSSIYYGRFDAILANFFRWSYPLSPQDAYNSYISGNGGSTGASNSTIHASLNLTTGNDNSPFSNWKIW